MHLGEYKEVGRLRKRTYRGSTAASAQQSHLTKVAALLEHCDWRPIQFHLRAWLPLLSLLPTSQECCCPKKWPIQQRPLWQPKTSVPGFIHSFLDHNGFASQRLNQGKDPTCRNLTRVSPVAMHEMQLFKLLEDLIQLPLQSHIHMPLKAPHDTAPGLRQTG